MKIYVASSSANTVYPEVVAQLRLAGHEVYDFRHPVNGAPFTWEQVDVTAPLVTGATWQTMLSHQAAREHYAMDMNALRSCDAVVLVMPSGRDAHLEAGWAAGAGKLTVMLAAQEADRAGLMVLMLSYFALTIQDALDYLAGPETK